MRLQHPRNQHFDAFCLFRGSLVGIHLDQLRNAVHEFCPPGDFLCPPLGRCHGARVPVAVDLIVEQADQCLRGKVGFELRFQV